MSRVLLGGILGITLSAMLGGCIFQTRTPEPPSGSNTFVRTPATTPEYLLDNFVGALKILDAPDYMRVFIGSADSTSGTKAFTFTPASGLDQSSLGIFAGWNVESEGAWLSKLSSLVPAGSQLSITLSDEKTNESANSATVSADYLISIPSSSSSSVLPSEVEGSFQMNLTFVTTDQGTSEWRIVTWSDFLSNNATVPSWTNLKVTLSS